VTKKINLSKSLFGNSLSYLRSFRRISRKKLHTAGLRYDIRFLLVLAVIISAVYAQPKKDAMDPTDVLFTETSKPAPAKVNQKSAAPLATRLPSAADIPLLTFTHTEKPSPNTEINLEEQRQQTASAKLELLREQFSATVPEDNQEKRNKLSEIIEKIQSVRFRNHRINPMDLIEEKTEQPAEPQKTGVIETASAVSDRQIAEPEFKKPAAAKIPINQETLNDLDFFIENPSYVQNPTLLADILSASGYKQQAAVFYAEAVRQATQDDKEISIHDKAWLMFQTASCLKTSNHEKALQAYKDVVSSFPSSTWAPAAKTQSDLIDWLLRENPYELLKQCRSELILTANDRRAQ